MKWIIEKIQNLTEIQTDLSTKTIGDNYKEYVINRVTFNIFLGTWKQIVNKIRIKFGYKF